MMITLLEIRHKLTNMNTREPLVIGALTIRFFKTRAYNRWQILLSKKVKTFSYAVYPEADYILGTIDQIGVRNDALMKAIAYILKHYDAAPPAEVKRCSQCGIVLAHPRSNYCGAECSQVDSNRRYQERKKAERRSA